jgi:phosphatidylethanolamine/phosphatidyl-N-methylethanolamine N-methyltransferase
LTLAELFVVIGTVPRPAGLAVMATTTDFTFHRQWRENLEFIRGLLANPRNVSSLFPSSPALARRIAAEVDPSANGIVVELGPGTGAVTCALLARGVTPGRLLLVERDPAFVALLQSRFPGIRVCHGNALDVDEVLTDSREAVVAIVSGLPLLNFSESVRLRLMERSLARLQPGHPFIQQSFGLWPPVSQNERWSVRSAGREYRNIPPAAVWVYTSG